MLDGSNSAPAPQETSGAFVEMGAVRDLVAEYKAQGGAYRQQVQEVMPSSYHSHYRQILPALLDVLDFRSNNTAYSGEQTD